MEDLVENYRLNLICPSEIADEDFDRFHTNLGKALKVCKYANNAMKLRKMVNSDSAYQSPDCDPEVKCDCMSRSRNHDQDVAAASFGMNVCLKEKYGQ